MKIQLKDIASVSKGKQLNASNLVETGNYDYLNGGIEPSGKYTEANVDGCTVTISEGGNSCGYVNYMNNDFWCGAHCYYLYDLKCESLYLYYNLKSQEHRIQSLRSGACMPNIKKNELKNLELNYDTSIELQHRIASVFHRLDGLIGVKEKQLNILNDLIKSRFNEMFGNPLLNDKKWNTKPFGELVDSIDSGTSFICQSWKREGNKPGMLKLSAVTSGTFCENENKELILEEQFNARFEVKEGDLLFTRKNTPELVGRCALVGKVTHGLVLPDLIFRLNVKEDRCNRLFIKELINSDDFRPAISSIAHGAAASMSNISKSNLSRLSFIVPPLKLQNEYSDFCIMVDKSKFAIEQSIEKLETLKASLMQEYFS